MDPKEIDAQIASLKAEIASLQAVKSRMSGPTEGEMTVKEMLEKLGDPRAAVASDDPVSEADKSKAVPSLSQYQKQQEDKQALFESLDRAEALAEPKAGTTKVDPALAAALEEETGPDMEGMLASLKGEEPAAEPEAAEGMTDEGYARLVKEQRREEEESAAVSRREKAELPPLSPSEAMRVEEEAKAEARRKGFDSLPYDDPIWLGEKPAAEPTGPATAAYEALDDEDQVAQAFEEAAAAAPEGVDVSGAAKAVPDQAEDLFKTVHGGPFDPNSSMDRGKLAQIEEMLASGEDFGDLSDREARNRFALKVYRKYDYV